MLIGIELINEHIMGMLANERNVIFQGSQPIAILSLHPKTGNSTVPIDSLDIICVTVHDDDVKIAKKLRSQSRSVTLVTVVSTARVFLPFKLTIALVQRQLLPVNGIMEVIPSTLFQKKLTNIVRRNVHVP